MEDKKLLPLFSYNTVRNTVSPFLVVALGGRGFVCLKSKEPIFFIKKKRFQGKKEKVK